MRAIVLAAGKSLQLDGANKILIRHPATGRTILDYMIDAFDGMRLTVILGYRAIDVMQAYPKLDYVLNLNWALTNNAMSLGLALEEEPTYVVAGDLFLERSLIERLEQGPANLAATRMTENRTPSSIHCVVDGAGNVTHVYQGLMRSPAHPESVGLFKLSDVEGLRAWKRSCVQHGNLFAGQLIPTSTVAIRSVDVGAHELYEINTPIDYLRLIAETRSSK